MLSRRHRKVCGGNRGWYSAETQQILMTLFRTAYQQGVNPVAIMNRPAPLTTTNNRTTRYALTGKPDP